MALAFIRTEEGNCADKSEATDEGTGRGTACIVLTIAVFTIAVFTIAVFTMAVFTIAVFTTRADGDGDGDDGEGWGGDCD
jgi:hypothetical protein